jgi:RNA-directed DNA polymerase
VDKAKPFDIPKREVWEAFKKKANQGAAGVDGQSVAAFEAVLSANLYKLWNRMSSGSYFPPPVRRVMIPKPGGGGERPLGIPTVADRIAQEVVKRYLEPLLEPIFHEDSYGYRPGRSAIDAIWKAHRLSQIAEIRQKLCIAQDCQREQVCRKIGDFRTL